MLYCESEEEFDAEILTVSPSELEEIDESGLFEFEWTKEEGNQIYKIVKTKQLSPLGLISIVEFPLESRIHIDLLENSIENQGKNKKIDGIAGCLIAFAVKLSFDKGYLGCTSLIPKTELIDLYVERYGFSQFGRQLAIEGTDALQLIHKYL